MQNDPHFYGLPSKVQLEYLGNNRLGIHKVIKSRIIQKDTTGIIEIAKQIKSKQSSDKPEETNQIAIARSIEAKNRFVRHGFLAQ